MCEYDVDCETIADLRDNQSRAKLGVTMEEIGCGWMSHQYRGKQAPSWLVADRLKKTGHTGTLVQSFAPGATKANVNLVLWTWGPNLPCRVEVYDPTGRLPANQLSWPASGEPENAKK